MFDERRRSNAYEAHTNEDRLRLYTVLLSCGVDLAQIEIDINNRQALELYLGERIFVQQKPIKNAGSSIERALFEFHPRELKPGIKELPHPSGLTLKEIPPLYDMPQPSVPMLNEALLPLLFKNGYEVAGAADVTMLANANYFSQASGDVVIRRVANAYYDTVQAKFPGITPMIVQRNGDAFLALIPPGYSDFLEDDFNENTIETTNNQLKAGKAWGLFAYGGSPSRVSNRSIGVDTNTNKIFLLEHPHLKPEPVISAEDVHQEKPIGDTLTFEERCAYLGKYRPQLRDVLTPLERQKNNPEVVRLIELMDFISFDPSTRALWIEMERSGNYEEAAFFDRIPDLQEYLLAEYGQNTGVTGFFLQLREDSGKLKVANDMGGYPAGNAVIRSDLLRQAEGKTRIIFFRKWGAFLEVTPVYGEETILPQYSVIRGDEVERIKRMDGMETVIPRVRIESVRHMRSIEESSREGIERLIFDMMVENTKKTVPALARYFGSKERLTRRENEFLHRYYYGEKRGVPRLIDLMTSLKDFFAEAGINYRGDFHFIGDQVDVIQNLLENHPTIGIHEIQHYLKIAYERIGSREML